MKSNIDLTENRIFSRINFDSIINVISNECSRVPWNIKIDNSGDEYDLLHQKKSLIALGDRKQREKIKLYRKMDSGNYCDRCGDRIMPWENKKRLCHRCEDSYLPRERCPWRKAT
nr:MAG TPA: 30S ribosomal protein S11 [Caudoviricetes sp.]